MIISTANSLTNNIYKQILCLIFFCPQLIQVHILIIAEVCILYQSNFLQLHPMQSNTDILWCNTLGLCACMTMAIYANWFNPNLAAFFFLWFRRNQAAICRACLCWLGSDYM